MRQTFDLSVAGILRDLDLQRPVYATTAAFGHFGREDVALPWEETPRLRHVQ
ncbi:MAG: methionine adenosyltransferase domain-containing protein [Pseudomonadota bacterium]